MLCQACDWTAEYTREEEHRSKKQRAGERGKALFTPNPMHTYPCLEEGVATSLARVSMCQGWWQQMDSGSFLPQDGPQGFQGLACQQLDLITSLQSEVMHLVE